MVTEGRWPMSSLEIQSPSTQEIFYVFPEISREEGTLANDRSVWPPWQVKMDASGDPNFMTPFIYISQPILLAQILHSPRKLIII